MGKPTKEVEKAQGAEATNEKESAAIEAVETVNEANLQISENIDLTGKLHLLEKATPSSFTLNATSKEFGIAETVRGFYIGENTMTFKDEQSSEPNATKTLKAVEWVDGTGKRFICASVVLVNAILGSRIAEGTPIEMTCTEKIKKVKMFDVRPLKLTEKSE